MSKTAFVALFLATLFFQAHSTCFAGPSDCSAVGLEDHLLPVILRPEAVERRLKARSKDVAVGEMKIGTKTFHLKANLGRSTSAVYLAEDEAGHPCVVKKPVSGMTDAPGAFAVYEKLATEYYRSLGEAVPGVLAVDPREGLLAKEYQEGLTYSELFKSRADDLFVPESKALSRRALQHRLDRERLRFMELHHGFKDWLKANHPDDLQVLHQLSWLVDFGDGKRVDNWLYDPKADRWYLIDP